MLCRTRRDGPVAGSAYTYAYATLGEFVAWIIGWDLILEYGISVAPTAAAWSGYVQATRKASVSRCPLGRGSRTSPSPAGGIDLAHSQVDLLAIGASSRSPRCSRSAFGSRRATNTLFVVIQVAAIVVFVVALAGAVSPSHFAPPFPPAAAA